MECFAGVEDPRINRRRRHLLIDLIVISICAVICNADIWKDISIWGQTHQAWLGQFLELPNGIPTHIAASFEKILEDESIDVDHQRRRVIDRKRPHGRHEERYYYTLPVPTPFEQHPSGRG